MSSIHKAITLVVVSAVMSATASAQHSLESRVRRVETGLLPAVVVTGNPTAAMTITGELERYRVPAVSIAVIDNYKGPVEPCLWCGNLRR